MYADINMVFLIAWATKGIRNMITDEQPFKEVHVAVGLLLLHRTSISSHNARIKAIYRKKNFPRAKKEPFNIKDMCG